MDICEINGFLLRDQICIEKNRRTKRLWVLFIILFLLFGLTIIFLAFRRKDSQNNEEITTPAPETTTNPAETTPPATTPPPAGPLKFDAAGIALLVFGVVICTLALYSLVRALPRFGPAPVRPVYVAAPPPPRAAFKLPKVKLPKIPTDKIKDAIRQGAPKAGIVAGIGATAAAAAKYGPDKVNEFMEKQRSDRERGKTNLRKQDYVVKKNEVKSDPSKRKNVLEKFFEDLFGKRDEPEKDMKREDKSNDSKKEEKQSETKKANKSDYDPLEFEDVLDDEDEIRETRKPKEYDHDPLEFEDLEEKNEDDENPRHELVRYRGNNSVKPKPLYDLDQIRRQQIRKIINEPNGNRTIHQYVKPNRHTESLTVDRPVNPGSGRNGTYSDYFLRSLRNGFRPTMGPTYRPGDDRGLPPTLPPFMPGGGGGGGNGPLPPTPRPGYDLPGNQRHIQPQSVLEYALGDLRSFNLVFFAILAYIFLGRRLTDEERENIGGDPRRPQRPYVQSGERRLTRLERIRILDEATDAENRGDHPLAERLRESVRLSTGEKPKGILNTVREKVVDTTRAITDAVGLTEREDEVPGTPPPRERMDQPDIDLLDLNRVAQRRAPEGNEKTRE